MIKSSLLVRTAALTAVVAVSLPVPAAGQTQPAPEPATLPAPAPSTDGTEDLSKISVQLDTLTLLSGKEGDIEVLQLLRVLNAGDLPFIGEPVDTAPGRQPPARRAVFRLPVPEGAFDIAPSDARNPQEMAEGPAGIVTTAPLPPGETLISFIYRVRPARSGWALRREIDYPTRSINLLLGPGLELHSGPGFDLTERKKLGEVQYRRYRAGPFSAGSVLTADVGFGGESPRNLWLAFASAAAAALALLLGLTLLIRRGRRRERISAAGAGEALPAPDLHDEPAGSRESLVLQIAQLDEQFDSGSLAEPAYRARRRELKDKLANLTESVSNEV